MLIASANMIHLAVFGCHGLLPFGRCRRGEKRAGGWHHRLPAAVHLGQAAGDMGEGLGDPGGAQE